MAAAMPLLHNRHAKISYGCFRAQNSQKNRLKNQRWTYVVHFARAILTYLPKCRALMERAKWENVALLLSAQLLLLLLILLFLV